MTYFSAWEIHCGGLRGLIAASLAADEIDSSDVVWRGPSGDVIVAASPYEIEGSEYDEYIDGGLVSEYV